MAAGKMYVYTKGKRQSGRKKAKTISKSAAKDVRAIAKQVVHSLAENKRANPKIEQDALVYQTLNTSTQVYDLYPAFFQGIEQGQRVANKIRIMKAKLHLQLHATQITATIAPGPNYFDIYIYKYKPSDSASAVNLADFLQFGNTAVAYNGNSQIYSGLLEVNKDIFTLKYKKRVKLWNAAEQVAGENVPNNCYNDVCPSGTSFTVDITKMMKKTLTFNDDVSADTQNDNLFMSIASTAVDGRNLGATFVGQFTYATEIEYEDM